MDFHRCMIKDGRGRLLSVFTIPRYYQNLQHIGSGTYGLVCSATDTRKSACNVAIKKITEPFRTATHALRVHREISLLKFLQHDNIISLIDIFTPDRSLDDFTDIYLVMPLMDMTLHQVIYNYQVPLPDEHIQLHLYQIFRALKYLHSAGIIHRDLKPDNIARTHDNDLKLLDFGFARKYDDSMTGYVVARWYRAPEVLLAWEHYTSSVDMWAVGCIMAEMYVKKPIFREDHHIDHLVKIIATLGSLPDDALQKYASPEAQNFLALLPQYPRRNMREIFPTIENSQAIDLLERLFDYDNDRRITAAEALAHPYFGHWRDEDDEPSCDLVFDASFESGNFDLATWKRMLFNLVNQQSKDKKSRVLA